MRNDDGDLTSINVLEYAALIIEYVATFHFLVHLEPDAADPHPVARLYADNTSAESWLVKSCKRSFIGRDLGRLQAALMINNPVGVHTAHVSTTDNKIADRISRIESEANLASEMPLVFQDFPQLRSCRRFVPSAELVSHITDILLQKSYVDPLEVSRLILAAPGKIIT